ncbi:hypothetical protein JTE90_015275 [Oedothorax gibbosus]|uniref:Uncharacterized protein n=1 Tax=Oedothorax gibbosus TaxID=931172 RepID=A0AAV6UDA8_9ARAC|nr:hypothetical protein JTE90_015275 [Oedothorax gibbosus]
MNKVGRYAMHFAAKIGDKDKVLELIHRGMSPDICDRRNYTLLYWAALYRRFEVVECLIPNNCDMNLQAE